MDDTAPVSVPLDRNASLREFLTTALAAALEDKHLRVTGHCIRGGCVIRYTLNVDSIDYATAFHSDPEMKH
jgi:hypothetical protein